MPDLIVPILSSDHQQTPPMRIHHPARPRHYGFTLIESMATIVILATLSMSASFLIITAVDGYIEAMTRAQLHSELSIAMDRIVRELRQIPLDPNAATPVPDITLIQSDFISWNAASAYALSYLAPPDLRLQAPAMGDLLHDVTAFTIAAYDEDNALLVLPLGDVPSEVVRRIEITITLTRSGVTESLRTKVYLRSTITGGA